MGLRKILLPVSFINFRVDSAMSTIIVNVWYTWMLELVNILVYNHLPENNLSLSRLFITTDHLLFCKHQASYVDFSTLTRESKKFY